ncbi:MAG: helix-turn-helix domain-containing protein, partial [Magnetovibrio sp.]|nr:helix-turn-helix domain-containing protein [Magnetovibrio sp.]
ALANMDEDNRALISPIPVHADIASRVSTTRETVARVMNDLARQGILERQKGALVVGDVDQLRDMVEEVRGE